MVASLETESQEMNARDVHIEPHGPLKRAYGLYAVSWISPSEHETLAGHEVAKASA